MLTSKFCRDTPAVLITTSEEVGRKAISFVNYLLERSELSTASLAKTSWDTFGEVIVVQTLDEAYSLGDEYASEHVQIFTRNPREALQKMNNYGALFLGEKTCVSYGDKVLIYSWLPLRGIVLISSFRLSALITSSQHARLPDTPVACGWGSICAL